MTSPMRERALLQSARDVLDKEGTMTPEFNAWQAGTGITHPLAAALADLRVAVAAYDTAG